MNLDELENELDRMGRRPVPAPRPEFVRTLLDSIQLDEDLPTPVPIQLARREPWARFRMVAVGAIAAALLSAVGLFSMFRSGNGGKQITISASPVNSSVGRPTKEITVGQDGSVSTEPGSYTAPCPSEGTKIPTVNGIYVCRAGETVLLVIEGQRILRAGPEDGSSPGDRSATSVPDEGSTTAPPSSSPSTVAQKPGASASVVTTTTAPGAPATTTTTTPTPPPSGGGGVTPPVPTPSFELSFTTPDDGSVTLKWDASKDPSFGRYAVLRTSSITDSVDTPMYDPADKSDVVTELVPASNTSYKERFVDVLPFGTSKVQYRVAVLDSNGNVIAMSTSTTLELKWELKPSEEPPTPTTTAPTTSTTAGAEGPSATTSTTARN